ncbi:uncharacterized protein LOC144140913 [Haemaphysalis longicornis]
MQVYATFVIHVLSSASLAAATDGPAAREPLWLDTSAGTSTQCASNPNTLACQAAPPPEEVWILQTSEIPSSSTSAAAIKRQHPGAPLCGLGGCATEQSSNPLLFVMQVYATFVIHVLSSASLAAATDGPAAREPLWLDTSAGTSTQCASNPNTLACQAAPPPEEVWILQTSEIPSSSTSAAAIKRQHPGAPLCGLGGCATEQSSNPLLFVMQVYATFVIHVLSSASLAAATDGPAAREPLWLDTSAGTSTQCASNPNTLACQAAPPPEEVWILQTSEIPSSSTSAAAIKRQHPGAPLCGLGGCATEQSSNPLLFVMQVSRQSSLFSKKSSNYCLVQLPSPQCCVCMAFECIDVIHCLLILLSGDIESNPGPLDDSAVILDELKKISAGQATLLSEVQDLKTQLHTTEKTISDLSNRITQLEKHYQSLSTVQTQITALETGAGVTARHIQTLEARFDDAENRSRRNNLIFYGLPDTNHSETFSESEELIMSLCSEHLNVEIDPKELERAHRLGRHKPGQNRPVIVKFTSFKTKETILSNGKKLKDTTYSIGQDFSRSVQNSRKHLIAFARSKSTAFSCPYKTLLLGSKRYVFDEMSQTVKEIT